MIPTLKVKHNFVARDMLTQEKFERDRYLGWNLSR